MLTFSAEVIGPCKPRFTKNTVNIVGAEDIGSKRLKLLMVMNVETVVDVVRGLLIPLFVAKEVSGVTEVVKVVGRPSAAVKAVLAVTFVVRAAVLATMEDG